jgi:hypothetical protein
MGSFQTLELIETFINYQESIKRCICIIYDPQRTKTGSLKVRPYCLHALCKHYYLDTARCSPVRVELEKGGLVGVEGGGALTDVVKNTRESQNSAEGGTALTLSLKNSDY